MNSIFSQLKVVDLSTVLAGPSVATFFAELGADVVKIENPKNPDVTRSWKLPSEDADKSISAYFASINFGKKYLQLDLKKEEDKVQLFDLLKNADILISNFKLGDEDKFGITEQVLGTINPTLIWGKINGFGTNSDRVAYDLILQAETGFMAMNGTHESGPVKMPVALIDVLAAHQLKEGLLISLYERQITGKGGIVSVSLYDAAICSLANQASNYLMQGHVPKPIGSLHPNIAPYGEIFETADHQLITFAIGSNQHFERLCNFLSLKELPKTDAYATNVQRVANREELFKILSDKIVQYSANEIEAYCHGELIPMGRIKSLDFVLNEANSLPLIREEFIEGVATKRITQIAFKKK